MGDIVSRRVEVDKRSSRYEVVSTHRDGRETRKVYSSENEFRKMLQDEAKRMEILAELASSKEERDLILDNLDRHLFVAQVYGFPVRSKYSDDLPRAGIIKRLYERGVEHR